MIIFDYGHTLLYEPEYDSLRGEQALFKYVTNNKNNLSAKDVNDFSQKLFEKIGDARKIGLEIHERQFQRLLYEFLEIELSITLPESEKVFWDNTSIGAIMPDSNKMIDYINSKGIRSGVISNIGFSGAALTDRINRLLPNNKFEFIIASSEYAVRKPDPMLFELALKKAGLSADGVWFCGDNIKADVEGAAGVGIFPVWYDDLTVENPWKGQNAELVPSCEHLHIHDWNEMIELLDSMK
jgi:putative hydrolase of the HAD superfamily